MTLLCDSPLTLQYIYKAYGLIELDRRLNSPFTRPPEQRWLLLCRRTQYVVELWQDEILQYI